ncbi:hypothetical protein [Pelagibius sp. 7325]|uniref:hypothetical protein n=1 Tax=Pelagibius sp. 7325 TaxID=3131994 RepID=UPI0030EF7A5D
MLRAPQRLLIAMALVLLALVVQPGPVAAQAQNDAERYVAGIPDLPLMPGLEALPDSGVVFDKPGGRIVEAFAQGNVSPPSVTAFYDETLPQLGWQREALGVYLREGERLQLAFSQDAGKITLHFRLLPQ